MNIVMSNSTQFSEGRDGRTEQMGSNISREFALTGAVVAFFYNGDGKWHNTAKVKSISIV